MWASASDPLPILTRPGDHTKSTRWCACVGAYQMLPDFTTAPIWLDPARETPLPTPRPGLVIEHILGYNDMDDRCEPGWHRVDSVADGGGGRHYKEVIDTIAEVAF